MSLLLVILTSLTLGDPRTGTLSLSPRVHLPFILHIGFSPELNRSMGSSSHVQSVGSAGVEGVSGKC